MTDMVDMIDKTDTVAEFLRGPSGNSWLHMPHVDVFVRKGYHVVDDEAISTFDIANIQVDLSRQGQGYFTRFLEHVETLLDDPALCGLIKGVYLENVYSDRFANKLIKMGFQPVPSRDYDINGRAPSYFSPLRLSFGSAATFYKEHAS